MSQRNMLAVFIKNGEIDLHVSNGTHIKFAEKVKTADLVIRFDLKDGVVVPKVCKDKFSKDRKAKRFKSVESILKSDLLLDY